jgi:hypothetical protein
LSAPQPQSIGSNFLVSLLFSTDELRSFEVSSL